MNLFNLLRWCFCFYGYQLIIWEHFYEDFWMKVWGFFLINFVEGEKIKILIHRSINALENVLILFTFDWFYCECMYLCFVCLNIFRSILMMKFLEKFWILNSFSFLFQFIARNTKELPWLVSPQNLLFLQAWASLSILISLKIFFFHHLLHHQNS